jgi:hypothetical protein
LRPPWTRAARDGLNDLGRDGGMVLLPIEQRNCSLERSVEPMVDVICAHRDSVTRADRLPVHENDLSASNAKSTAS